jgi:hypothetical protein
MEFGAGIIVMSGLALISLGYGWALALGALGLISVYLILSGCGTLMSSLVLSAVSKARSHGLPKTEDIIEW